MFKHTPVIALLLIVTLVLCSCGGGTTPDPSEEPAPGTTAVITTPTEDVQPGPTEDVNVTPSEDIQSGTVARIVPLSEFEIWEEMYAEILADRRADTDLYGYRWGGYYGIASADVLYSFCDIDLNGMAELVFLNATSNVLGIYTIADGDTISLANSEIGDVYYVEIFSDGEIGVDWEYWAGSLPHGYDIYRINSDGTALELAANVSLEIGRPSEDGDDESFHTDYVPAGYVINEELQTKRLNG